MHNCLLIDFGSTFTKVTAVDLEAEALLGQATAVTTVHDITQGLAAALEQLGERLGRLEFAAKLACSSAAGGLRMVAVGLVPELTAEAARRAALGAGARVVGVFSFRLGPRQQAEIAALEPDIVLLAGGTDGGNRAALLHNARALARVALRAPVIVAGNREAAEEARLLLHEAGVEARVAGNVLPRLGQLAVEPAREAIRQVFLQRIVEAKGLTRAESLIDGVVMPTPAAVLAAARLLAEGSGGEPGLGDLLLVDVGGATTDVHSVAEGVPAEEDVALKGLPEPYAKRTVEGDLGVRVSAESLVQAVGAEALAELTGLSPAAAAEAARLRSDEPGQLPADALDAAVDTALARLAVRHATRRHAGRLEVLHTPAGIRRLQFGKDLRRVGHVIGTGGVIVHSPRPGPILGESLYAEGSPELLPRSPRMVVDRQYLLAPLGLLAERHPRQALRMLKRHLQEADAE